MNTEEFSTIDDEELPFGKSNNSVLKKPICLCPKCGGDILEGERSFYCSNSTKSNGNKCSLVLYKNNIEKLIRRDITSNEVTDLCETGSFTTTCTKLDGSGTYTGIFKLKPMGTYAGLSLSFPE